MYHRGKVCVSADLSQLCIVAVYIQVVLKVRLEMLHYGRSVVVVNLLSSSLEVQTLLLGKVDTCTDKVKTAQVGRCHLPNKACSARSDWEVESPSKSFFGVYTYTIS